MAVPTYDVRFIKMYGGWYMVRVPALNYVGDSHMDRVNLFGFDGEARSVVEKALGESDGFNVNVTVEG